jgi:hypothetical protein
LLYLSAFVVTVKDVFLPVKDLFVVAAMENPMVVATGE